MKINLAMVDCTNERGKKPRRFALIEKEGRVTRVFAFGFAAVTLAMVLAFAIRTGSTPLIHG